MKSIKCLIILVVILSFSCGIKYRNQLDILKVYDSNPHLIGILSHTYVFNKSDTDTTYGLTSDNAVKVAIRTDVDTLVGPKMEHLYMAHLNCLCGGGLKYFRIGSCCNIKSDFAVIGDAILLDIYKIKCSECSKTEEIYLNMYDHGKKVYAPAGFTLKLIE